MVALWIVADLFDAASRNELLSDGTIEITLIPQWLTQFDAALKASLKSRWLTWFDTSTRSKTTSTLEALILGFSDQQLVTGIALLVTAQIKICDISKYHYETTLLLATISSGVHMMTLIVLRGYLLKHKAVLVFRVLATVVHSALTLMMILKVLLSTHNETEANARWPLRCFYSEISHITYSYPREGYPISVYRLITFFNSY